MEGSIKNVIQDRGFGFIKIAGGNSDVFFHVSALEGLEFDASLVEQRVRFELRTMPDGKVRAINVRATT